MLLEKMYIKRFKEIVLIDSENVGYGLVDHIPSYQLVYLFVSDVNIIKKLEFCELPRQIRLIDISFMKSSLGVIKNAMDFCIVSQLSQLALYVSKKQKIIVLSKDKGYDASIRYLRTLYPHIHIIRYPFSYVRYVNRDNEMNVSLLLDQNIKKIIEQNYNMKDLKKNLKKDQRRLFYIESYKEPISGTPLYIEYDIYNHQYGLYNGGTLVRTYNHLKEAYMDYYPMVERLQKKYSNFQSRQQWMKAIKFHLHGLIIHGALNNLSLEETLIQRFGIIEGKRMYRKLT